MTMKRFFDAAEYHADRLLHGSGSGPAPRVLDRALARATTVWIHLKRQPGLVRPAFLLTPGQGAKARARILVAGASFGLPDSSMMPGESIAEWLGRGLRERLQHDQILPLLRAAGKMRHVDPKDLESRAR